MDTLDTSNEQSFFARYRETNPVEVATYELMGALRNGRLNGAMSLIKSANKEQKLQKNNTFPSFRYTEVIDSLMANCENHKKSREDVFTPEQRVQIFDELVKGIPNPLDFISKKAMDEALNWGRAEMIPKLEAIGVKIEDRHFIEAANPIHRPNKAIETMAAVLPYINNNVNVIDPLTGKNAGHVVAGKADLKAFKWLEEHELKIHTFAKGMWPSTYAHMVASGLDNSKDAERIEFASYLVDNEYPIDRLGRDHTTPTDVAINEGRIDIALIYINAGAEAKPEYLSRMINATHFNRGTAEDVIAIGEKLAKKNKTNEKAGTSSYRKLLNVLAQKNNMNEDTVLLAYRELFHILDMNDKNMKQAVPIAKYLSFKGITPHEAAKKLQNKEKGIKSSDPDFITKTCNLLEKAIKENKVYKTHEAKLEL